MKIGGLELSGEGRNFGFLGDGSFRTLPGFGIFISVGSATGSSFKWPSFLPVRIDSIGIEWEDVENAPEDFVLVLSASVTEIKGLAGLEFSGSIQGVRIQPSLLAAGEFPIIGIDALGVTVKGSMFGGEIDAGLVGGILRLDEDFNPIGVFDRTTPVHKRVFYLGLHGGFSMAGMAGFTIRVGLSELGPLQVFLNVEVPGGILLEPTSGLTINDFSAGVEFFKTLPSIDDPFALRNSAFDLPTTVPADQWLTSLQQQVALQAKRLDADPSLNGFTAAFTAPMTITGSARIYSIYTSQQVFNGLVTIKISTDGKFLIHGQLNFAANQLSLSGRLYADLSQVASGNVTILFLADIPDQARVLTLYGKIKMGFRNASGQEVTFTVPTEGGGTNGTTVPPTGTVVDPVGNGGSVDVETLRQILDQSGDPSAAQQHYLDVIYQAAPGATIDWLDPGRRRQEADPEDRRHQRHAAEGTPWAGTITAVPMIGITTPEGLTYYRLRYARSPEGSRRSTTEPPGTSPTPRCNDVDVVVLTSTELDIASPTDAQMLAAAMRVTGSNRIRYLLGTDRDRHGCGAGRARRRHVQERRQRVGDRRPEHEDHHQVHRHRHHGQRGQPGRRRQHRRQPGQRPRLPRRAPGQPPHQPGGGSPARRWGVGQPLRHRVERCRDQQRHRRG